MGKLKIVLSIVAMHIRRLDSIGQEFQLVPFWKQLQRMIIGVINGRFKIKDVLLLTKATKYIMLKYKITRLFAPRRISPWASGGVIFWGWLHAY
jgi:hypothetical protein